MGRFSAILLTLLLVGSASEAKVKRDSKSQIYTGKLFQRLVGTPLPVGSPLAVRMEQAIAKGDFAKAAEYAITDKKFYSVRLRNFAAPLGNVDETPDDTFNDLQAMVIGVARDDLDARLLLTGDFRYQGYRDLPLPMPTRNSNEHYAQFERNGYDYWRDLMYVGKQWPDIDEAAGVLTTRAWANAHLNAGTNRRAVKYTFQAFLCAPIEKWRDRAVPDRFVRRDVDRNNAGNPANYQNECRACHGPMDSMGGAFARYDFVGGELTYAANGVATKMNQNGNVYPEGYVTLDDSWLNYATQHHNVSFGWRGKIKGVGIKEFGTMIANSRAYSECFVKRVFKEVCKRPVSEQDAATLTKLADNFETGGYKLKKLFIQTATENGCLEHP